MQQLSLCFTELDELTAFLQAEGTRTALAGARSVLAQIYTGVCDQRWIGQLIAGVADTDDKIVVVGATTFGEIERGRALVRTNVVSLICFKAASLVPSHLACASGQESAAAMQVARRFGSISEPVKGMLLVATTLSIDCAELLTQLHAAAPDIPVFGRGSGDNGDHQQTFVFSNSGVTASGVVAVALCGQTLNLAQRSYLGWASMGKPMTITRASGFTLYTIDDRPAFEVYRRYLGIDADENFFFNAVEFPFLVERNGEQVARVPHAIRADGGIQFVADLREGERINFGYVHVDTLTTNIASTVGEIRAFAPEAINIYSGGCRQFVMQNEVDQELAPFQGIAPTAGFFTYGEFCSLDASGTLLNSALLVVGMREGPARSQTAHAHVAALPQDDGQAADDIYAHNHMRVLSRFQHFMQAITKDLEQANEKLARIADYDHLTGLCNRHVLESRLTDEIERCRRYDRKCSLIFCDIDRFKQFNDTFGHPAGDFVLREIGALIASNVRVTDVICRYGGEEFLLLLTETETGMASALAERIRKQAAKLVLEHDEGRLPTVTLSFGIACFPRDADNLTDLISAADQALYEAKRAGRNCLRVGGASAMRRIPAG